MEGHDKGRREFVVKSPMVVVTAPVKSLLLSEAATAGIDLVSRMCPPGCIPGYRGGCDHDD